MNSSDAGNEDSFDAERPLGRQPVPLPLVDRSGGPESLILAILALLKIPLKFLL